MANENRTAAPLLEALRNAPHRFGFVQAMRRLECVYKNYERFGRSQRPVSEVPVRLGQDIGLHFEAATLTEFGSRKEGVLPVLKQRFFGLFGPNGPMPIHLTEYIHERIHKHRDHTLVGFADMFHHRMVCLFYRAYANTEPTISFDRPESDRFSTYVGSLSGLGMPAQHGRDAMPDLAKWYYTGFLSNQCKSAEALRALLADYFRLGVSIEQFVGEWLDILPVDLTRLGDSRRTGELGISTVLGSKVWSCQHKFRIRLGPLSLTEYVSLLPSGHRLAQLIAIIRNYNGDELSWDVMLVLKKAEVPKARLGANTLLGWTSWLGARPSAQDADDLKLNPFWGRL